MIEKTLLLINSFDNCVKDGHITDLDTFLKQIGEVTELISRLPKDKREIFFDKMDMYSQMLDIHIRNLEEHCKAIKEEIKINELRTKAAKSYSYA